MRWIFKHGDTYAMNDVRLLNDWMRHGLSTSYASSKMAVNNGWNTAPIDKEFVDLANSLGYRRKER